MSTNEFIALILGVVAGLCIALSVSIIYLMDWPPDIYIIMNGNSTIPQSGSVNDPLIIESPIHRGQVTCCGSMKPTFNDGDYLTWEDLNLNDPVHIGDIVMWKHAEKGATHRIIGYCDGSKGYIIMGDNNNWPDVVNGSNVIQREWIFAKVLTIEKK